MSRVLGIETSCDETSAAVVADGRIAAEATASQVDVHARFGGVVPEIASRNHLAALPAIVADVLGRAPGPLDGVAVTAAPGLVGALLTGLHFAKGFALARGLPLVAVHHIEAHLRAVDLLPDGPRPPYVGFVVSGGHTHLYVVHETGRLTTIGRTLDDAMGEAFDKTAKLLGLGYPGGPVIDRLAAAGDPSAFAFPRAVQHDGTLDFSFSGLKTAVRDLVRRRFPDLLEPPADPAARAADARVLDVAASFQAAAIEVPAAKAAAALQRAGLRDLVVAGGAAANSGLRAALAARVRPPHRLHLVPPRLCTDNGAMVAAAGAAYLVAGRTSPDDVNAHAVLDADELAHDVLTRRVARANP